MKIALIKNTQKLLSARKPKNKRRKTVSTRGQRKRVWLFILLLMGFGGSKLWVFGRIHVEAAIGLLTHVIS